MLPGRKNGVFAAKATEKASRSPMRLALEMGAIGLAFQHYMNVLSRPPRRGWKGPRKQYDESLTTRCYPYDDSGTGPYTALGCILVTQHHLSSPASQVCSQAGRGCTASSGHPIQECYQLRCSIRACRSNGIELISRCNIICCPLRGIEPPCSGRFSPNVHRPDAFSRCDGVAQPPLAKISLA
jgi:hypothetical protein